MSPTPERWRSMEELYQAALGLPAGDRPAFLQKACGDESLRREIESLLQFASDDETLLQDSPWTPDPAVEPGTELGPYRVGTKLGAGGMGEVYRAHDVRLQRDVALKILPAYMVGDADRRARFLREARAASRLNHPNTVTIYDIGEQDGRIFIAMEYLEGKTLDAVIPSSGLRAEALLRYAIPIASALAKAHAAGIVHRDLKPGNIMIGSDGSVKVLDFGLAKLIGDGPKAGAASDLQTQSGVFMGTPAYMSPEQAEGKPVDPRSDIFSFGSVLYHMATGKRPFTGNSMTAVMAAVLHQEPDPPPDTVGIELRKIILRCLRKEPGRRFQTMADLRVSLEELSEPTVQGGGSVSRTAAPESPRQSPARNAWWVGAAVVLVLAAAFAGARWFRHAADGPVLRTVRFTITPKQLLRGGDGQVDAAVTVSPDGRHIAYVESAGGQLWVRDIDEEQARPVPGATGVYEAFWSPDNRMIGYSVGRGNCSHAPCDLVKIPVEGGTPVLITRLQSFRRASWSSDGETIIYGQAPDGLFSIPARGGTPTLVIRHPHLEHPSFVDLPGGRHAYLFQTGDPKATAPLPHSIYIQVAGESQARLIVATSSTNPYPAYGPSGHIVYVDGEGESSTIWALPYSLAKLQPTGKPFPIAQRGSSPRMSQTGTLVYSDVPSNRWQLKWVDRAGATLSTIGEPEHQDGPSLSPDERKLVVQGTGSGGGLWMYDLATGIRARFVLETAVHPYTAWTAAGDEVTYAEARGGRFYLLSKRSSGDGDAKPMSDDSIPMSAPHWSPDNRYLIYTSAATETKTRLLYRERGPGGAMAEPVAFLNGAFNEKQPRFSPDGRYVAYVSDESGKDEVYVRDFPSAANKHQVSANGGTLPRWRRDGRELYYVAARKLFAVNVALKPILTTGVPAPLFGIKALSPAYDVSADGKRFVILDRPAEEPPLAIHVVHNWYEEFRQQQDGRR